MVAFDADLARSALPLLVLLLPKIPSSPSSSPSASSASCSSMAPGKAPCESFADGIIRRQSHSSQSSLVQLLPPVLLPLSESLSSECTSSSCSSCCCCGCISVIGLIESSPCRSEPLLSVLQRLVNPGLEGGNRARGVDPDPDPKRPFVNAACGVLIPLSPVDWF